MRSLSSLHPFYLLMETITWLFVLNLNYEMTNMAFWVIAKVYSSVCFQTCWKSFNCFIMCESRLFLFLESHFLATLFIFALGYHPNSL